MSTAVLHTIIAVAVLAAYVVLTALGHDGNPVLGVLGGQFLGGIATEVTTKATT